MTSTAPGRPRLAGLLSGGGESPLPERPLLTTPPHLQPPHAASLQRERLAAQPWLGLGGLLLAAVVFFALALGTGSTAASLLILGPLATFALPAVAMVAFWWNDWPGSALSTQGWPVNTVARRWLRLLTGNVLVLGLGALTYAALRKLAHWQPAAIGAVCGCVISAVLVVAMLFEGWPAARLRPAPARALALVIAALVALALNRALAGCAGSVHWIRATPDDWVTTAALSFIGAGIILHVGTGLRWPFAQKTKGNP